MARAMAAVIGFPQSDWYSAVMQPTSAQQRLVETPATSPQVHAALTDLLSYCRELDQALRRAGDASPLARIAAMMRDRGMPDKTIWHTFRTLATGSVTPTGVLDTFMAKLIGTEGLVPAFREYPHLRPGVISEIMRTTAHFGLMNPRLLKQPVRLADGSEIPAGAVIPSMTGALGDPDRFPGGMTFDMHRKPVTDPWGWGPHSCPAYNLSHGGLLAAADALTSTYRSPMYIDPDPVVSDGLLPGLDKLVVRCDTTPVARPAGRERASGEAPTTAAQQIPAVTISSPKVKAVGGPEGG